MDSAPIEADIMVISPIPESVSLSGSVPATPVVTKAAPAAKPRCTGQKRHARAELNQRLATARRIKAEKKSQSGAEAGEVGNPLRSQRLCRRVAKQAVKEDIIDGERRRTALEKAADTITATIPALPRQTAKPRPPSRPYTTIGAATAAATQLSRPLPPPQPQPHPPVQLHAHIQAARQAQMVQAAHTRSVWDDPGVVQRLQPGVGQPLQPLVQVQQPQVSALGGGFNVLSAPPSVLPSLSPDPVASRPMLSAFNSGSYAPQPQPQPQMYFSATLPPSVSPTPFTHTFSAHSSPAPVFSYNPGSAPFGGLEFTSLSLNPQGYEDRFEIPSSSPFN